MLGNLIPARGEIHTTRMLGPILLPQEAESIRQQLAAWASKGRIEGDDFTIDYHGHRIYKVSKVKSLVEPLLRILNREGCQCQIYRSSINKMVSTFRETTLIPISAVSDEPKIIDLTHGIQRLLPGYYYVLRSDIWVGPEADFIVVKERPEELACIG